jgi:hypothetical protein
MKKERFHHLFSYLTLFTILGIGSLSFYLYKGAPDNQFLLVVTTSFLYFFWGVMHHLLEDDLHPKIVVEYLFISLLAIFLLRGAIYR